MSEAGDQLVLDYLDRVAAEAQRRMAPTDRLRLVEELRARIEADRRARGGGPDAVRSILARHGAPKAQVDDYLQSLHEAAADRLDRAAAAEHAAAERAAADRAAVERAAADRAAEGDPSGPRPEGDAGATPERRTAETRPSPTAPQGPPSGAAATPAVAAAARRAVRRAVAAAPTLRDRTTERSRDEANASLVIVGSLLAVALVIGLLGWWGALAVAVVGLVWPRAPRGAKVAALVLLPLWLVLPAVLIGLVANWSLVMGRLFPLVLGVLGTAYLHWASRRLPVARDGVTRPRASDSSG